MDARPRRDRGWPCTNRPDVHAPGARRLAGKASSCLRTAVGAGCAGSCTRRGSSFPSSTRLHTQAEPRNPRPAWEAALRTTPHRRRGAGARRRPFENALLSPARLPAVERLGRGSGAAAVLVDPVEQPPVEPVVALRENRVVRGRMPEDRHRAAVLGYGLEGLDRNLERGLRVEAEVALFGKGRVPEDEREPPPAPLA